MSISIVIPTVKGREEWLDACVSAYEATTPGAQIIVVRGEKSCGLAWLKGAERAKGDYLHFTADDLVPFEGWWQAGTAVCDRGELPAAHVLTARLDNGEWDLESTMYAQAYLAGNIATPNVLVPLLSRSQFEKGEWLLPIHYGSDDWVTFLADRLRIPTPSIDAYAFGHGAAPEGRLFESRAVDIPILCEHMAAFGPVPIAYRQMGLSYGWLEPELRNLDPAERTATVVRPVEEAVRITETPGYYWTGPQQAPPAPAPDTKTTAARR